MGADRGAPMPAGRHPHFDAAEFGGRVARLQARLRDAGVDIALFDEVEAMTWISGFGNSENRWRCGYTLGFYAQAGPRTSYFTRIFHPGATWRLEPQMVFHMYASAQGASYSETVLVTATGPEHLTRLPRTLIINS